MLHRECDKISLLDKKYQPFKNFPGLKLELSPDWWFCEFDPIFFLNFLPKKLPLSKTNITLNTNVKSKTASNAYCKNPEVKSLRKFAIIISLNILKNEKNFV